MGKKFGILLATVCIAGAAFCDQAADAKKAVEGYLKTFKKGNPAEIFQLFPNSYQRDVNDLLRLAGNKFDAEVWKASTDLLAEASGTARAQKKLLAEMIVSEKKPTPKQLKDAESQVLAASDVLSALSEISIDTLKKGDTIALLNNPKIAKLGASSLPEDFDISKYRVTGAKQTEKGVSITITDGKESDEIPMVLVDSVWIPSDMADGWKEVISSSKKEIQSFSITPEMKKKILTIAPMLKMGLSQMKIAKTKEQLQMGAMGMMMPIMMTFGGEENGEKEEKEEKPVKAEAKE